MNFFKALIGYRSKFLVFIPVKLPFWGKDHYFVAACRHSSKRYVSKDDHDMMRGVCSYFLFQRDERQIQVIDIVPKTFSYHFPASIASTVNAIHHCILFTNKYMKLADTFQWQLKLYPICQNVVNDGNTFAMCVFNFRFTFAKS